VDVIDPSAVEFICPVPQCFVVGKSASFKGNILLGLIPWYSFNKAVDYITLQVNATSYDMFFLYSQPFFLKSFV